MELLRDFSHITKENVDLAGGKGASLGEMTKAGIPVPPGFVILSASFEKFLEETDLNVEIDSILESVDHRAMHTVENASEKIQALILGSEMPKDIADLIESSFKELDAKFVAVRSSATAEDSASAAWAGQLDSFLNTTHDQLLENVRRCWASLFTPRAIFYRFEKELHHQKISVAVVVQKMVESEKSGIAFSVHPVTEDRNQLIIEAGFGLGEAIVSGSVTPDSYVVEKEPRRIIDVNISEQTRALYRVDAGGNEWRDIPEPQASSQVLSEKEIHELSEIILRIENHYGFPCDIEWAFEQGVFYIVQSRPITTLMPLSPTSFSPLSLDPKDYRYIGLYKSPPYSLWHWSAWYDAELAKEFEIPEGFNGYFGLRGGNTLSLLETEEGFKKLVQAKVDANDVSYFDSFYDALDREFKLAEAFAKKLGSKIDQKTYDELERHAHRLIFFCFVNWHISNQFDRIFKEAAREAGIVEDDIQNYVPLPKTRLNEQHDDALEIKTMIESKGYWELLKTNPALAISNIESDAKIGKRIRRHLETYAWLNTQNWIGEALTIEKLLEQMTLLAHEEKHIKTAPPAFEHFVQIAARLGKLRNAGIEDFCLYSFAVRSFLETIAKNADVTYRDFLLLTPPEIFVDGELATDLKEKVARRQNENWCIYPNPQTGNIEINDDAAIVATIADRFLPKVEVSSDGSIKGQIGNKGKVTGSVRVILATDEFHKMRDGDVLVTPMTTPDFVLLMHKSAAIVTDMGGLLCHAAIVSRELNKPCVIDTKFATQLLKDDDIVEVDADHGIVRILKKSDSKTEQHIFHKIYTRDTTYIMQELWGYACSDGIEKEFGWKNPHLPGIIHHMNQGLIEIWENLEATQWLKDEVLKRNIEDPTFIDQVLKTYREKLMLLNPLWKKESLSVADMKRLIEIAKEAIAYLAFYFYSAADERTPFVIREKALKMREQDEFFAENDTAIRSCLTQNFPDLHGFETSMFMNELDTVPEKQVLEARREYSFLVQGKEQFVGSQDAFQKLHPDFIFFEESVEHVSVSELKGEIAQKGIATGRVKILQRRDQMDKVEEGDILVSSMTTPDFISAMKKAAAFVTDEGGITCHAGIVARELKKPCIIGTKIATQVLHDGDLVEVDADHGIVRIIEKAK